MASFRDKHRVENALVSVNSGTTKDEAGKIDNMLCKIRKNRRPVFGPMLVNYATGKSG